MVDPIFSDVAVTWLGAAGCMMYCRFLWRHREEGATGASLFLFGVLSFLLAVRGFYWLYGTTGSGQMVFAAATLLPLAIALYTERLLRRHHPFLLKLTALAAAAFFFIANLFGDFVVSGPGLLAFLVSLLLVCAWNSVLLMRAKKEELTLNETRRAYAMVIVTVLALPLVVTDFRTELTFIPNRLGALAALLCVYVLLRIEHGRMVVQRLLQRLGVILIASLLLALLVSLVIIGPEAKLRQAIAASLPLAMAWMLLTGIWVRMAALNAETRSQSFMRWLLHARVDGVDGFLSSLRYLPLMQEHVVLDHDLLTGYRENELAVLLQGREPINVTEVRAITRSEGGALQEAAEQLLDLLGRYQMTHAFMVSDKPIRILLVNLPEGADAVVGRLQAGIVQRLARRMSGTAW